MQYMRKLLILLGSTSRVYNGGDVFILSPLNLLLPSAQMNLPTRRHGPAHGLLMSYDIWPYLSRNSNFGRYRYL